MSRKVLITDGNERAALALSRSLGRAGHRVFVCSTAQRSLAGASRFVEAEASVPDPLTASAAYVEAIVALAAERGIDVIVPVTEASLLCLLPLEDKLPGVVIPFGSIESFKAVSDKARLMRAAADVGIATPAQHEIGSHEEALAFEAADLTFPVVLKPSRSVVGVNGTRRKVGVAHAATPSEFATRMAELSPEAFPVLVQQRVVGPGVGIFLLLWAGGPLAVFSHRRIREKPPSGGVSVYRESVPADPDLVRRSQALLESFDWQGVAMVEYKIDEVTGTPYLMEINGRFWGSLQLAIDAGVDFPALLVAAATGAQPAPVRHYRTGVRSRWWWGDVDHLLLRLRRSNRQLSLPPGTSGRARAIAEFFTLWSPGDRNEIFRLSDPLPLVRESLEWFRSLKR
jgi:predicted ATP-grasp superfamily ATP-dependent carboligase